MLNENIELRTEVIMGQCLQMDLKNATTKLTKKRNNIRKYCEKQAAAPKATSSQKLTPVPKPITMLVLDEDEQKQVTDWAKDNYQGVADIKRCADELSIKAGQVYYTLKKHSFIKQKETTEHRVLSAYYKHSGNLAKIAEETGLGVWIVAKTVESLGYSPRWHDYKKSRYSIRTADRGLGAERKFKEFVPDAVDMNDDFRECNPLYDFVVNDYTVDVKEATPITDNRYKNPLKYWQCRLSADTGNRADFYCLFLCYDREKRVEGDYVVLLIPKDALPDESKQMRISLNPKAPSHQLWFQFQVEPIALPYMLGLDY